jgi:hypothetical protein
LVAARRSSRCWRWWLFLEIFHEGHLSDSEWHRILVSDDHIMVLQEFLDILDKHTSWFFRSDIITLGVAKAE